MIKITFCLFQASNISHTDNSDTEQNSTLVDTFREPIPPPPPTKKKKIAQLSSMVSQLKEIADTTNSTVEENEFDVFGKHVGLQLKSLPLLLALDAQEHIQLYINSIRREHIQNASEQNRITRTPRSSHSAESPHYSDSSIYYNDNSNYNLEEQAIECIYNHENETQSNVTVTSNNLIFTALRNANVDNQK